MKQVMSYNEYLAYMRSDAWKDLKKRYQESKLPQNCAACGWPREAGFTYHHRTYKRLGREWLMDLMPLCWACHKRLHDAYKEAQRRYWRGEVKHKPNLWVFSKRYCRAQMKKDGAASHI